MVNDTRESVKVAPGDERGGIPACLLQAPSSPMSTPMERPSGPWVQLSRRPTSLFVHDQGGIPESFFGERAQPFVADRSHVSVVAFVTIIRDIDILVRCPLPSPASWEEGRSQRTPYNDSNDAPWCHWLRSAPLSLHTIQFSGVSKRCNQFYCFSAARS